MGGKEAEDGLSGRVHHGTDWVFFLFWIKVLADRITGFPYGKYSSYIGMDGFTKGVSIRWFGGMVRFVFEVGDQRASLTHHALRSGIKDKRSLAFDGHLHE